VSPSESFSNPESPGALGVKVSAGVDVVKSRSRPGVLY
jgi:hypothetical protein